MAKQSLCLAEGCSNPAKSKGRCAKHYYRWKVYGTDDAPVSAGLYERFHSRVVVMSSGCWSWSGARNKQGYGHIGIAASKNAKAHRVSYEIHFGKIPNGALVCHSCDNPWCVNPMHLFLGSHQVNMADRGEKGRTATGERNGKSKITREIAAYIKQSALSERVIALELGVHRGTVNAVRSGKTWKDV